MKKLAIGICAALLSVTSAAAQGQEQGEDGALLVIMDISGSMAEDDGSGAPRIEGAQAAVEDLVDTVPDSTRIGLRVYGDQYAGDDQDEGCQDTRLAVPIGPVTSSGPQIVSEIDDVAPLGFTPIGASLQAAADDFTDEANRSIVLVSDGEDTCGEPRPCEVAEELTSAGINVRVDTIGLTIEDNPTAQRELECIAEATGGTYVEAADAGELSEQLTQVSTRAIQGWSASGQEVDGGPIVTQATPIEPGTTYLDDVVEGEARWYSFPLEEGQEATMTLSEDGTVDYGCCVKLRLYYPDQQTANWTQSGNSRGVAQIVRTETPTNGAPESGEYYLSVVLDGQLDDTEGALEYQLDVAVDAESGADGSEETEAPSQDSSPATVTVTADPAEDAVTPSGPDESVATAQDEGDEGGTSLLTILVAVLALAVLALVAAVGWLFSRLRSQDRSG